MISKSELDKLLPQAIDAIRETGIASTAMLQMRLKIGYGTASNIMDRLEEIGMVGPAIGATPRKIYLEQDQ